MAIDTKTASNGDILLTRTWIRLSAWSGHTNLRNHATGALRPLRIPGPSRSRRTGPRIGETRLNLDGAFRRG